MIKKLILSLSFSALCIQPTGLIAHNHAQLTPHNYELIETGAKVAFFIAVIASCTYAFYKLASWLLTKSDEQILSEAQNCYSAAKKSYKLLIARWLESNEGSTQNDEHILAHLPLENGNAVDSLGKTVKELKQHALNLKARLENFSKGKKHTPALKNNMKKLLGSVQSLIQSLKPISSYAHHHISYFQLKDLVARLQKDYCKELNGIEQRHDEHTMHKIIAALIMSTATKYQYPYIRYIDRISHDIANVKKPYDKIIFYPCLAKAAEHLVECLECIHSLVLIHPAYHTELQERERIKLEKERIELERAKVQAQEEQARALNEQNWLRLLEIANQERIIKKIDEKY